MRIQFEISSRVEYPVTPCPVCHQYICVAMRTKYLYYCLLYTNIITDLIQILLLTLHNYYIIILVIH